jgi:hypothetical protein
MPTRLATRAVATIGAAAALVAAACAHPGAGARPDADSWEARYAHAAGCVMRVSLGPTAPDPAGTGALVVRLTRFGAADPVRGAQITLVPLGAPAPAPAGPPYSSDSSAARTFPGLAPGRYTLGVRLLGLWPRTDTVTVRAGAVDTVDVAADDFDSGYRNVHNCRPRGFRRAGESACATDAEAAEQALDLARDYASPAGRRTFRLPAGDTVPAPALVRDERVCERAGRAYGGPESPPRRVAVVAVGGLFVVYDPYEPRAAGEWNVWMVFDRRWRSLAGILN